MYDIMQRNVRRDYAILQLTYVDRYDLWQDSAITKFYHVYLMHLKGQECPLLSIALQ